MLKIKMYPAKNGDAFLLKWHAEESVAILIDGGYPSTFQKFIRPDLTQLAELGYILDLVVITHIDADHISGLLELFKTNGNSNSPEIIQVKDVWHNSLRSISTAEKSDITHDDKNLLTEIRSRGYPPLFECAGESSEISARQGSSLAALLFGGGYSWNTGDGTKSITSGQDVFLGLQSAVRLRVIGPSLNRLTQLRQQWVSDLRQIGFAGKIGAGGEFDDAFEFLCAFEELQTGLNTEAVALSASESRNLEDVYKADISIPNSSSIALVIEIGTLRLLFLGDAWAEDIEEELRRLPGATFPMIFDVIKIAHHGSLHNTSPALLALIDAPIFLISSSGERHNHPDLEVLKAIVDRPSTFSRNLHFNYTTSASQQMRHYIAKSGSSFTIFEDATNWIEIGAK